MELILASASPRRRELLSLMGLPFSVMVSGADESAPASLSPDALVCRLAQKKAEYIAKKRPKACVIGADTLVSIDGEILGKPGTAEKAKSYLRKLSGREHSVFTGLCVITPSGINTRFAETKVRFRPLVKEEIDWYVATGDPLDKAGAYGVQGAACCFVDAVEGNYFNVVGLPLPLLYEMLLQAGYIDRSRRLL